MLPVALVYLIAACIKVLPWICQAKIFLLLKVVPLFPNVKLIYSLFLNKSIQI